MTVQVAWVISLNKMSGNEDYYKTLGIDRNATPEDIKKAFVQNSFYFLYINILAILVDHLLLCRSVWLFFDLLNMLWNTDNSANWKELYKLKIELLITLVLHTAYQFSFVWLFISK